jgi:hypothetical protein
MIYDALAYSNDQILRVDNLDIRKTRESCFVERENGRQGHRSSLGQSDEHTFNAPQLGGGL